MNVELMKRISLTIPIIFILTIIGGCGEDRKEGNNNQLNGVEYSPEKDARIQQYNLEPVSYTHLTLPTILLV